MADNSEWYPENFLAIASRELNPVTLIYVVLDPAPCANPHVIGM